MTTESETTAVFPLAHVLSIVTGRLVCEMGGIHQILNHITGDYLLPHEIPNASQFAALLLHERFPDLRIASEPAHQDRLNALLATEEDQLAARQSWCESLPLPQTLEIPVWANAWSSGPFTNVQAEERP